MCHRCLYKRSGRLFENGKNGNSNSNIKGNNIGNIKSSSLNRSELYLNKSGTALLTKNFAKVVHSDWLYGNIDGQVNNITKGSS